VPPYYGPTTSAAEREYLKDLSETLQTQLGDIKKRLDDLTAQESEKSE
jgi:hypothetical protein